MKSTRLAAFCFCGTQIRVVGDLRLIRKRFARLEADHLQARVRTGGKTAVSRNEVIGEILWDGNEHINMAIPSQIHMR